MKILIIEAIFAGLLRNFSLSILPEALSMIIAISKDFKRLGHMVSLIIDKRFLKFIPFNHLDTEIIKVDHLNMGLIRKIASNYDFTYVIAPESENILFNLLTNLENCHLNSNPDVIARVSNKYNVINALSRKGLYLPRSAVVNRSTSIRRSLSDFSFPLVIKPVKGVGCEGLKLIRNMADLHHYLLRAIRRYGDVLVQEYIRGIPASISSVTDGNRALVLSVNRQFISFRQQSYLGGYTPIKHVNLKEINRVVKEITSVFRGLRGYFGVDIVFSKNHPYVMEINPRLTVSYIGLSKVLVSNPAKLILKSTLNSLNDKVNIAYEGIAYFRKIKIKGLFSAELRHKIYFSYNLYTPLIPSNNKFFYSMILLHNSSYRSAVNRYRYTIRSIKEMMSKREFIN